MAGNGPDAIRLEGGFLKAMPKNEGANGIGPPIALPNGKRNKTHPSRPRHILQRKRAGAGGARGCGVKAKMAGANVRFGSPSLYEVERRDRGAYSRGLIVQNHIPNHKFSLFTRRDDLIKGLGACSEGCAAVAVLRPGDLNVLDRKSRIVLNLNREILFVDEHGSI